MSIHQSIQWVFYLLIAYEHKLLRKWIHIKKLARKTLKNLINLDQIFSISLSSIEYSLVDEGDGTKSWENNEISAFN